MAERAQFTGQTYGTAARQEASQKVVPTGPPPTEPGAGIVPLNASTQRPNEPITAGIPMGAGPGPEAIAPVGIQPGSKEDLILTIRAVASRYPNPAVLALLSDLESM